MFEYIVQPGDTIYRIADYFDVSIQAILNANPGLNPDYLYIGQQLRIPISRFLYQSYPWYYLYPYLFIRFPRSHWDDRRRWPSGRRDNDGRRDRSGWWNNNRWRNFDGGLGLGGGGNFDGGRDMGGRGNFDGGRGMGSRGNFDGGRGMGGGRGRQNMGTGAFESDEQEMWYETSEFPDQG